MVFVPRIVILILAMVVALSCHRLLAQDLPVYTTATLPDGSTESVYQLTPGQPTTFEVPQISTERWKHYRLCTWDRRWFALPIETEGFYAICGAVRKFGPSGPRFYEERNVLGVYDRLEDITRPSMSRSDVIKFPLRRKAPDIYIFRGEPGQVWATQLVINGTQPTNTFTIGAEKAIKLSPDTTHHGQIATDLPLTLFELYTQVGKTYKLTLNARETIGLFRLAATGPTAVRILSSTNSIKGEYSMPLADVFTAQPDTRYLAMVLLTGEEGEYDFQFREVATSAKGAAAWQTIKYDDGEQDSMWGQVSGGNEVLYKEIVLAEDPANIRQAVIQYQMGYDPYDWASQNYFDGAPADKEWPDLEVYLNDQLVLKRPFDEVATAGWYELSVDPAILKHGTNVISFTAESGGGACYYLAIDLDSDYGHSSCALDGQILKDELRPCITCSHHVFRPGEYIIRLKYLTK